MECYLIEIQALSDGEAYFLPRLLDCVYKFMVMMLPVSAKSENLLPLSTDMSLSPLPRLSVRLEKFCVATEGESSFSLSRGSKFQRDNTRYTRTYCLTGVRINPSLGLYGGRSYELFVSGGSKENQLHPSIDNSIMIISLLLSPL